MEKRFNVTFEGLSIEVQREIISHADEEEILWKGATSKDLKTRLITLKNPKTTSKMLEKMLQEAENEDYDLIEAIWEDERLIQTEELIKSLRKSHNSEIRQKSAETIQDEDLLDEMMKYELETGKNHNVIMAIFCNKSYVQNNQNDIIKAYKQLYADNERLMLINSINEDKILDEFLNIEINNNRNYVDDDIIVPILNHSMWIPKREMLQDLIKKAHKRIRERIAEQLSNPNVISMMLEEELLGEENPDVLEKLIDNPKCKLSTEKEEILFKKVNWSFREKIAKESKDSKLLNKLLLWELENDDDCDVIMAILENKTFVLTTEWQEKLYRNGYDAVRKWLAENANEGSVLGRWYLEEKEEDIVELIVANKYFSKVEQEPLKISIFKKEE